MHVAAHILAASTHHRFMAGELASNGTIVVGFVGDQTGLARQIGADNVSDLAGRLSARNERTGRAGRAID